MTDSKPLAGIQIHGGDPAETAALIDELHIDLALAHFNWGNVEKSPGERDWSDLEWWARLGETGAKVPERIWTMYTVHMVHRGPLPSDLAQKAWDAPEMADRFESFIVDAADRAGWREGRPIILIGNEIDAWAGGHQEEIDPYTNFANEVAGRIKRHLPNVRVINTFTPEALDRPWGPDLVKALNDKTDLLALDWYDLRGDFTVEMSSLAEFVDRWKAVVPGKPVLINEIGLPSSPVCGSSEKKQADRINELFDYLEKHTREEVEGACWLGLDDWNKDFIRGYVDQVFGFLSGNEQFFEFLTSLGIRDQDKKPKEGFGVWRERSLAYRRS